MKHNQKTSTPRPTRKISGRWLWFFVATVLLGVPLLILLFQAHHTGLSLGQVIQHAFRVSRPDPSTGKPVPPATGQKIDFLTPGEIGFSAADPPRVGSITLTDLDRDGQMDVLVCDMFVNRIGWIRQSPPGVFTEQWVSPTLPAPARVSAVDMDGDGDLDLLVAAMGQLFPSNDKIGSVILLENDSQENFQPYTLLERVARVTDVRAADFNRDGKMDLIVGQFGYDDGETRWMENLGNRQFRSHRLQSLSGVIHTIPVDMDKDGDTDVVSLVSQEWEEIYLFENDGRGNFQAHLIWGSANEDYGSSGMRVDDLDRDGQADILFTNGDAFDYLPPRPRPWHSVQWLRNLGRGKFEHRPIGKYEGASGAVAADVDRDGDLDVIAVSCYNFWEKPDSQSMIWFENDGRMNFVQRDIAHMPTHLINLETADMNRDGKEDFVSARMDVYPPFTKDGRVVLWLNHWPPTAGQAR